MSADLVEVIEETSIVQAEGDVEVFAVGIQGPPGTSSSFDKSEIIQGEVPAGAIDGANATFTTGFDFRPESVAVYVNGLKQRNPTDFATSGVNTIQFTTSPETGDDIRVNYIKF